MNIVEFLEARIAEDEAVATALLRDLQGQVAEEYADAVDEKGPMTPTRLLKAQLWAQYDGQSKRRSFAKGQQIASLADPARVLAECGAKRAVIQSYRSCQHAEGEARKSMSDDVQEFGVKLVSSGMVRGMELAVQHLAAAYADHPNYREEWRHA